MQLDGWISVWVEKQWVRIFSYHCTNKPFPGVFPGIATDHFTWMFEFINIKNWNKLLSVSLLLILSLLLLSFWLIFKQYIFFSYNLRSVLFPFLSFPFHLLPELELIEGAYPLFFYYDVKELSNAMFTRDTSAWAKCHFTIENVTQYNKNVNLPQVNRVNKAYCKYVGYSILRL